jgi:hypothetical protein
MKIHQLLCSRRYCKAITACLKHNKMASAKYGDNYFAMKILLEKHREFNLETHIAFVNLTKAFLEKLT